MAAAEFERTTVDIDAGTGARKVGLRATGQVERFNGFLAVYQEGRDDARLARPRAIPTTAYACRR
jgi:DNA topoisomerase-1